MLGRLFNAATSTTSSPSGTRPSTSHGSESDELQTRLLLYPDSSSSVTSSFHSFSTTNSLGHSSISSISSAESLDLDPARDVRVIIAQDGSTPELKAVLFDSKPNAHASQTLGSDDGSSSPSLGGPYGRSRRRTAAAQPAGAANEELRVFTDCMFGAATLAYKGPSTKIHILPNVEEPRGPPPAPVTAPSRRGSLRLGRQKEPILPSQPQPAPGKRKLVLVTRLFSVTLPAAPMVYEGARSIPNAAGDRTPTPVSSVGSNNGFPFPKVAGHAPTSNPKLIKPPRTSMYAVGIIVSVPAGTPEASSGLTQRGDFANPTPPSYEDNFPVISPSGMSMESNMSDAAATNGCMSIITKHWDVITRALSDLQHVAQDRIKVTLTSAAGISSPSAMQNGYKYTNRIELKKMALMRDDAVCSEVERLRWRVASGIRIPRVVVGQGRWDVWHEEAQWASNKFCGRRMNFFFLTLLTAFLGHHTGWLEVLGPDSHKRRHLQTLAKTIHEHSAIPTRTVILSSDRIAARKLIYLLSAFIPSQPHLTLDAPPPPWIASSINYLSQSPPTFTSSPATSAPGSKMGSVRRKAVAKKPSKLNMVSNDGDGPDVVDSIAGWDIPRAPCSGTSSAVASAQHLPHAPHIIKKCSSNGTLATALSSGTVMGTSTESPQKSSPLRPGSRDSSASINLMGTLRRSGTTNTSADSSESKWGSFLSYWSNPKSSSSVATSEPDDLQVPSSGTSPQELGLSTLSLDDEMLSPPPLPTSFSPVNQDIRCSVDEIDGTIDVDIPLGPSFTSPLGSPPQNQPWLTPLPSLPSIVSMPPLRQPPTTMSEHDGLTTNVAGWIDDERFHPDFLLQAIPSYPAVEAEIKHAMHMEPTPEPAPVYFVNTPASETHPQANWVTVAETIVADTGKLQIKRIRLLRRFTGYALDTPATTSTGRFSGIGAPSDEEYEERWEEEVMVDMDDTLATAVEKAIGVVPRSPGSLEHQHQQELEGATCRAAVLGALSQVVKGVMKGDCGASHENVLTDGVKKWIWGAQEAF